MVVIVNFPKVGNAVKIKSSKIVFAVRVVACVEILKLWTFCIIFSHVAKGKSATPFVSITLPPEKVKDNIYRLNKAIAKLKYDVPNATSYIPPFLIEKTISLRYHHFSNN